MMYIAGCRVVLRISESQSLKDKRRIVKSILERIRTHFNVSAAEVGRLGSRQEAELGMAGVSNEPGHARQIIEAAIRFVESDGRAEIIAVERDV